MAEVAAKMLMLTLLLLAVGCMSAKRFAIMAPNVFHIGVTEQVSIAVYDAGNPVNVKLYLQDYPHRKKTFSQVQGRVGQGSNIFLPVKVEPENLPDTSSVDKQYVYLVAKSDDGHFRFHKEAKILLSYKDGMVFIQTDKPIYTPRQRVKIRVFPLEFDMKPSQRKITVVVMNPQGIKVQQWKDQHTSTGIISKSFDLDDSILMGYWTITAVYGHQDIHNTSVQFEVKEYVLPKFSVKIKAPPYILKTDNQIKINITTRYTYGKPVIGSAAVHLSIEGRNGQNVPFAKHNIELDRSGVTTLTERIRIIQDLPGNLWFPEDSRLQIQADVIERATGNKESALDKSCKFTSSPYLIQFKNTAKYFKPGLRFVVKVVVTYPNKQPARNVPMLISAKGKHANRMIKLRTFDRDPNVRGFTNSLGEAEFVVDACNCALITIEVRTDNNKLDDSQNAVAMYVVKPFDAENGPLIMVRQLTPGKVGRKVQCETYRSRNDGATKLSFAIVSRGRILSHNTTGPFDGMFRSWSFRITSQMSPSARVIVYYIDNNGRVAADSILLKVEDTLPTTVDFPGAFKDQVQLNEVEKRPGARYSLKVKAPQGTRLGLLCVDQSIYLLRNENRLTKERIFKTAEALDLGCGVGGGKNSKDIFKNAGVVLMTENFVSDGRNDYGCGDDNSRKKRNAADDEKNDEICCDMGKNTRNVTWKQLSVNSTTHLSMAQHETKGTTRIRRSGMGIGDFGPSYVEIFDQTVVRSFFPETWILDEKLVGPGELVQMDVTVPDTVTTCVMQVVAINDKTGLGLATPLRIVGYREFFVSLHLPYSVKLGEQVSLLATVFNYYENKMRAELYLNDNKKDFCSVATDDKLTLIGTVEVPSNDVRSVSVPIVPKRIGKVDITVYAVLQMNVGSEDKPIYMNMGGDTVRRKLLVVMAANYNLPTSRNETCKFDLKTTVKVIREQTPGELFGPVKKGGLSRVQKKKAGKKKKGGKRSKAGCKGRNKNKWKCRNKGRKPKNKKKPQLKLVKSLQLKVCTRYRERGNTSSAIMDIGILNGFGPDLKSLQNLQTTLPEMDKYEVSYRSLVIYLSKVPSHRALCVDVQFDRLYDVGMVQAVPVKVYHYEPDESCSVFYELDKTRVLPLGVCDVGSRYCKCINDNDKCAPQDPPIGNVDSLINKACTMYHYAIKGKVLLITRNRDGMIEYVVDVLQIIQQGNKVLKLGQRIELLKHRDCVWSPDLKELEDYLFMGLEKGDRYSLDGSSFVKLWPKRPGNNKDKVILENFAAQYTC